MSLVSAPLGLIAIRDDLTGAAPSTIELAGGIQSGYASNLFIGQPVIMAGGFLTAATTAADIWGVFAGCSYKRPGDILAQEGYWPASTTLDTSIPVYAYYWPANATTTFRIQAAGSIAQTAINSTYDFTTGSVGTGDTLSGNSSTAMSTTANVTSGQVGQLRVTNLWDAPDNAWGDAFTWVEVQVARSQILADKTNP